MMRLTYHKEVLVPSASRRFPQPPFLLSIAPPAPPIAPRGRPSPP